MGLCISKFFSSSVDTPNKGINALLSSCLIHNDNMSRKFRLKGGHHHGSSIGQKGSIGKGARDN